MPFKDTMDATRKKRPLKGRKGNPASLAKANAARLIKAAERKAVRTQEEIAAKELKRKLSQRETNRKAVLKYKRSNRPLAREIGLFEVKINWERRLACKKSLRLFCETYLQAVFYHGWSDDQLTCIEKAQIVCSEGGKFCVAMPRGGGKTAIVRAATLWSTLYGLKRFIYNVGSTEPKATQTLNFIKVQLENNPLLRQDFPELCWPIFCLEGTNRMARGQLFNGESTHCHIASDYIRYPILQLPPEIGEIYEKHDPQSVRYINPAGDYGAVVARFHGPGVHAEPVGAVSESGVLANEQGVQQPDQPEAANTGGDQKGKRRNDRKGRKDKGGTTQVHDEGSVDTGRSIQGMAGDTSGVYYEQHDLGRDADQIQDVSRLRSVQVQPGGVFPSPREPGGFFIPTNAGVILRCSGIDGSIRGEAEVDPVTLEQPRPDLVILDDVQKDAKADSPVMCEKLIRLIDGAVTGLSGGGQHIDVLMPCTVIREGDAADTYLDPLKKPDFLGERCAMVKSWPAGVTDFEITNETTAGKYWNTYAELRRTGLRDKGHTRDATDFLKKHQSSMEKGFVVSWAHRYDKRSEISAQQHAMNLRLQLGAMFLPEYQNIGRRLVEAADTMITAEQLMNKVVDYKRGQVPPNCQQIVAHIDVQDEVLFYLVFAFDYDFNGVFIDYGTWPDITLPYFTKSQTASWSSITNLFFKRHPELRSKAFRTSGGKVRAPLEAKLYWALGELVTFLKSKSYPRQDMAKKGLPISYISIDTRWGQGSEAVKRYIRESGHKELIPYYGQAFQPTQRQLEEYERREGWLFENMKLPNVKEPKWVIRPNPDGMWYMAADVNRLKDFLFARLATPLGSPGNVALYSAPSEQHELISHHICSSEYPEPLSARGITKNQWTVREGTAFDNDYLDCAAGCMATAGFCGASTKTTDNPIKSVKRILSQVRASKAEGKRLILDRRSQQ